VKPFSFSIIMAVVFGKHTLLDAHVTQAILSKVSAASALFEGDFQAIHETTVATHWAFHFDGVWFEAGRQQYGNAPYEAKYGSDPPGVYITVGADDNRWLTFLNYENGNSSRFIVERQGEHNGDGNFVEEGVSTLGAVENDACRKLRQYCKNGDITALDVAKWAARWNDGIANYHLFTGPNCQSFVKDACTFLKVTPPKRESVFKATTRFGVAAGVTTTAVTGVAANTATQAVAQVTADVARGQAMRVAGSRAIGGSGEVVKLIIKRDAARLAAAEASTVLGCASAAAGPVLWTTAVAGGGARYLAHEFGGAEGEDKEQLKDNCEVSATVSTGVLVGTCVGGPVGAAVGGVLGVATFGMSKGIRKLMG